MGETRHRYVSFHERLQHVTIDLSRESSASWGASSRLQVAGLDAPASAFAAATDGASVAAATSAALESTAFGSALAQWAELNLSLPFQDVFAHVQPMSRSLVLLLHHRDEIAAELDAGLVLADQRWLAWDAFLDLVPRLAFDLGPEFLPVYPRLLRAVLRASSLMDKNVTHNDDALAARLVERAFHSAAWLFRAVASLVVRGDADLLLTSWHMVQEVLGARLTVPGAPAATPKAHTRRFAAEAFAHLVRQAPQPLLVRLVPAMYADAARDAAIERGVAATWAHACSTAAHALHSRTPELLACALAERSPLVARTGERVFTALAHHATAATMAPALDVALAWADCDAPDVPLQWLTAAVGTRKGTRVDDVHKPRLFALLAALDARTAYTPANAPLLEALARLVCLALPLARVQDMTGTGKALLAQLSDRAARDAGLPWALFDGVVRALGAPGACAHFAAFVLPRALDATAAALDAGGTHADAALVLLAALDAQGHLAPLRAARSGAR